LIKGSHSPVHLLRSISRRRHAGPHIFSRRPPRPPRHLTPGQRQYWDLIANLKFPPPSSPSSPPFSPLLKIDPLCLPGNNSRRLCCLLSLPPCLSSALAFVRAFATTLKILKSTSPLFIGLFPSPPPKLKDCPFSIRDDAPPPPFLCFPFPFFFSLCPRFQFRVRMRKAPPFLHSVFFRPTSFFFFLDFQSSFSF